MQLSVSIDQEDAEGRVHVAVLEAIVQQYHLGALGLGQGHQVAHRPAAVAVDDETHLGIFEAQLLRLIAYLLYAGPWSDVL